MFKEYGASCPTHIQLYHQVLHFLPALLIDCPLNYVEGWLFLMRKRYKQMGIVTQQYYGIINYTISNRLFNALDDSRIFRSAVYNARSQSWTIRMHHCHNDDTSQASPGSPRICNSCCTMYICFILILLLLCPSCSYHCTALPVHTLTAHLHSLISSKVLNFSW
jgi:hypothetical protein